MINCITSIHLMDLLGEKIDNLSEKIKTEAKLSSRLTKAIARTMLPTLKVAITKWMLAKMRVRKAIFPDNTKPEVMTLLRSSLWEADIIPLRDINNLKRDGPLHNLVPILGMNLPTAKRTYTESYTYNQYNSQPDKRRRFQDNRPVRGRGFRNNRQFNQRQSTETRQYDTEQPAFRQNQQRGRGFQKQPAVNRSSNNRGQTRGRGNQNGSRNRQIQNKSFQYNKEPKEKSQDQEK